MNDIGRLELCVHPFDNINTYYIMARQEGVVSTKYKADYTKENEKMMMQRYKRRIRAVSYLPDTHLIFIAHSPITKGIMHENTKEMLYYILDNVPEPNYTILEYYLDPDVFNFKIKPRLSNNLIVRAWGEKTSGCVLDDLLNLYILTGMEIDINNIISSLAADSSVDFDEGFPRLWEKLNSREEVNRLSYFRNMVSKRINQKMANGYQSR